MTNPIISVAIATWNRCDLLRELLISLENQTISRDQYVISVYDSMSPDNTKAMVEEMANIYGNIRYVNVAVNAPAHKRNAALADTTSPLIMFMDDDLIAYPNLLQAHLTAHQGLSNMVFCGQVRFPQRLTKTSNYFRFRDSRHLGLSRKNLDTSNLPFKFIVVMNMSANLQELRSFVGRFSEEFVGYAGEDYEYGYRVGKSGMRISYVDKALAIHREASHGVEKFSNKLRLMARDSGPILNRLVPPEGLPQSLLLLEPLSTNDSITAHIKKMVVQGLLDRHLAAFIQRYLEITDGISWLYFPILYHYLLTFAYFDGVQQRNAKPFANR